MIDARYASIKCQCGALFQALCQAELEDGSALVDWEEEATAQAYHEHLLVCVGG